MKKTTALDREKARDFVLDGQWHGKYLPAQFILDLLDDCDALLLLASENTRRVNAHE